MKPDKSPMVPHLQLKHESCGIVAPKIREAEMMVNGGIEDILVAYPIRGEQKLSRLDRLMEQAKMRISLDRTGWMVKVVSEDETRSIVKRLALQGIYVEPTSGVAPAILDKLLLKGSCPERSE